MKAERFTTKLYIYILIFYSFTKPITGTKDLIYKNIKISNLISQLQSNKMIKNKNSFDANANKTKHSTEIYCFMFKTASV